MVRHRAWYWVLCDRSPADFRYRCSGNLERLGDAAVDSKQNEEAHRHYSAAVSIYPANAQGFFVLRSKLCMAKGSWEDAIDEANQVRQFCLVQVHSC